MKKELKLITKEEFDIYMKENNYSYFMQSSQWGDFAEKEKDRKSYYFAMVDSKNKVLCASLIFIRNYVFGFKSGYCPHGFFMDYKYFNDYVNLLKDYMKKNHIIRIIFNPLIENNEDNKKIFNKINSITHHNGFNKLFEACEPRSTFIVPLEDGYENKFSKSMKQNIRRANSYGVEIVKEDVSKIDIFYKLMSTCGENDNFLPYKKRYYKSFLETMKRSALFIAYVDPDKIVEFYKNESDSSRKENMIKKYENIHEKFPACAHIMICDDKIATCLYAGNNIEYMDSCANYLMYDTKLKYAKSCGCEKIDLFGVPNDPNTKYKNLAGIYNFKKQFGGNFVEYLGDFEILNSSKGFIDIIEFILKGIGFILRKLHIRK